MDESSVHTILVWIQLMLAVPTALALLVRTAPYGRYRRSGWGPTISSRWGWVLMESPAAVGFLVIYLLGDLKLHAAPLLFLAMWQSHYLFRTFVMPLRMGRAGQRMPLVIPLMGFAFNCLNAYINARWISHLHAYDDSWLLDPRFLAGVAIFFVGMAINRRSDRVLLALRKPGETGYHIPRGGLYRWVSCPNYLGEIIEWTGYAIATWSLAGSAFAVYTVANLAPRALSHHAWYRSHFSDYPSERKSLIPRIL